jgi:hypothetical protein
VHENPTAGSKGTGVSSSVQGHPQARYANDKLQALGKVTCRICFIHKIRTGFGDFKIGGQVINTVKYADDLVLLAKEEMVL